MIVVAGLGLRALGVEGWAGCGPVWSGADGLCSPEWFFCFMKRIIWLLILASAGYGVWRYYPELERQARNLTGQVEEAGPEPGEEEPGEEDGRLLRLIDDGVLAEAKSGAPVEERSGEEERELEARYPWPEFQPIEELVGNWKKIPASAFPRQVTLREPATLRLSRGEGVSVLAAGRKVWALGAAPDGGLLIAPSQDAVMRGVAAVDSTDFKEVMERVYDDFKGRKRAEVDKLRAAARKDGGRLEKTASGVVVAGDRSAPAAALAAIGPRPAQKADLTVPVVEANLAERWKAKKQAEPPAGAVLGWGPLRYCEVEGEPYWGASVRYRARTIFGEFPTEAIALVRQGRVVKWIYAGTGEPLP